MKEYRLAFRDKKTRARLTEKRTINPAFFDEKATKKLLEEATEYAEKNNWKLIAIDEI